MTKKLYIKTYGCQMNKYDSSRIIDLFKSLGDFVNVDRPEIADILLINSCSIREKAQEKVFSELGRWRLLKKKKPELIIGVGGCVASQEGKMILRRAPYVDLIFGPQTLHRLPLLYKNAIKYNQAQIDISFPEIEKFDYLPTPKSNEVTAYVTVMEGCNNFCSYCVVPYTRGKEISRPVEDIISEIKLLAAQGAREITLLGQNVNNYKGYDSTGSIYRLHQLIKEIAKISGIDRIRFMTSHPYAFSDDLIAAYKDIPQLANHLHLPVQSGSNKILSEMKRNYTADEFINKIDKLRKMRPNISISSDFIVGFPGETEDDFQDTLNLVKKIGFDNSYSFIYSKRPGTLANKQKDDISLTEKKSRLIKLQALLNKSAQQISQNMVGTEQTILVSSQSKKNIHELSGRTENNRVVNFSCDQPLIGKFVKVRIKQALQNSLRGESI